MSTITMLIAITVIIALAASLLRESYRNGSLPSVLKGLAVVAGAWGLHAVLA